jgi:hypothetical protein
MLNPNVINNKMLTMGQALDAATREHERRYPVAHVYEASVSELGGLQWRVEVRSDHFSVPLVYWVDSTDGSVRTWR